jgi:hypothetical protein
MQLTCLRDIRATRINARAIGYSGPGACESLSEQVATEEDFLHYEQETSSMLRACSKVKERALSTAKCNLCMDVGGQVQTSPATAGRKDAAGDRGAECHLFSLPCSVLGEALECRLSRMAAAISFECSLLGEGPVVTSWSEGQINL